jgi:hypothetical protein
MGTAVLTCTPTGNCTFTSNAGNAGDIVTFSILTSGNASRTLTWGSGFTATGTLATGTTTGKRFNVTFRCIAATPTWSEMCRTAAQ